MVNGTARLLGPGGMAVVKVKAARKRAARAADRARAASAPVALRFGTRQRPSAGATQDNGGGLPKSSTSRRTSHAGPAAPAPLCV